MIQKIRNLIFDLFRVRILGSDHDLCCFLSHLFQNLVNPLIKQIVGIRSFLRMLLSVCNRCIYRFKNLKRIFRIVLISYNLPIKCRYDFRYGRPLRSALPWPATYRCHSRLTAPLHTDNVRRFSPFTQRHCLLLL